MNRLVLFDIDKTLIDRKNGDTGKFHYATEKVYGVRGKRMVTHGMTDQQILIDILKRGKIPEAVIQSKMEECKKVMTDYYKENMKNYKYTVFGGVIDLLKELSKNKVPIGLVTGNIQEISYLKLKKVKLEKFFRFGGFGSDAVKRSDIIKIAIERAEEKYGPFSDIFVIGDSPKDIEAGKEAGIKTIGVATGVYSESALKRCKPDYVLPNLKNTQKILDIITG